MNGPTYGFCTGVCPTDLIRCKINGQGIWQLDGWSLNENGPVRSVQIGPLNFWSCSVPIGPEDFPAVTEMRMTTQLLKCGIRTLGTHPREG